MEDMISRSIMIDWLKAKIKENQTPYNDYRIERAIAYEDLLTVLTTGDHFFDVGSDPIPLPTIKPGDKGYKCPCGVTSSEEAWNESTDNYYDGDATTINDSKTLNLASHFICPACGDKVELYEMEVSHD